MLSRSVTRGIASIERQCLREQFLRSRKCARCFHASVRKRADESNTTPAGNDNGTPYNAPKTGRSRQQRAAELSQEVQELAQGASSPPPSAVQDDTSTVPELEQDDVPVEREMDSPQILDVNTASQPEAISSAESDEVVEAAQEIASTPSEKQEFDEDEEQDEEEEEDDRPADLITQSPQPATETATNVPAPVQSFSSHAQAQAVRSRPAAVTRVERQERGAKELLYGRHNAGTIVGGNYMGAISNHLNSVVQNPKGTLPPAETVNNLNYGRHRLHIFPSVEELKATQQAQEQEEQTTRRRGSEDKADRSIVGLTAETQKKIVDRFVQGKYDGVDALFGKEVHANPSIDTINVLMKKNPTFTLRDGQRVLDRVMGLLPRAPAAPKANTDAARD